MINARTFRRRRGWSQAELARRAGLHPSTVSLIESQRLRPYPGQLAKLARALGVAPEEIEQETAGERLGMIASPGTEGAEQ